MSNYRQISLPPSISKIFEKCFVKRIMSFLDQNKILSKRQFGFRRKVSTKSAIAELVAFVYSALDNSVSSVAVFIDLAKAFDTLNHRILSERTPQHIGSS